MISPRGRDVADAVCNTSVGATQNSRHATTKLLIIAAGSASLREAEDHYQTNTRWCSMTGIT
jgi:hypothetical protein